MSNKDNDDSSNNNQSLVTVIVKRIAKKDYGFDYKKQNLLVNGFKNFKINKI